MDYLPTPEQEHAVKLLKETSDNIQINSYAGTGKTTTLDLLQASSPVKPVLCIAFQRSVAEEMSKRFPSTTTVRTFNSLGHRIWDKANVKGISFDSDKVKKILKLELQELKGSDYKEASEAYWEIIGYVSLAKALGYVPDGKFLQARRLISRTELIQRLEDKPSELTLELGEKVLTTSIRAAYEGSIDYNDQIYMPALFGGTFPRFPLVLVDEDQDLSPVNHAMLDKLGKSRICGVGDEFQAIYAFRGADSQSVRKFRERFKCIETDLTVSFRCPSNIVNSVKWRVPKMRSSRAGGKYAKLGQLQANSIPDGAAIICRNNAPLFRTALHLLSIRRSVSVAGSDIGPRLLRLLAKLGDGEMSKANVLAAINDWRDAKLETTNNAAVVLDMAECMRVFASFGETLSQATAYAEHLFKQQGTIRLLTGHKAKGLEWDIVYHLDPWMIGEGDQEDNLRYVIGTRAKQESYEINSKAIRW